jgi:hypothetical protein
MADDAICNIGRCQDQDMFVAIAVISACESAVGRVERKSLSARAGLPQAVDAREFSTNSNISYANEG